jgi:hypothetical protein
MLWLAAVVSLKADTEVWLAAVVSLQAEAVLSLVAVVSFQPEAVLWPAAVVYSQLKEVLLLEAFFVGDGSFPLHLSYKKVGTKCKNLVCWSFFLHQIFLFEKDQISPLGIIYSSSVLNKFLKVYYLFLAYAIICTFLCKKFSKTKTMS